MRKLFLSVSMMTLVCTTTASLAQNAGSVQFPSGYAPGQSICVKQPDGTCVPVSTTNPLPVSGGGGGGGAGDASAANQTTQIAAEQAIQAAIGAASASPNANTIGDRLKVLNTTLGVPFQAGASIGNTGFAINGTLPAFAATPTFNIGTAPTINVAGTFWQATQPVSGAVGANLRDGGGANITSTLIGGKQRLDVTLAAGVAPGTTAPTFMEQVGGSDGTNARAFLTDTSGRLAVNVNASALPTGAATETTLAAANTRLTSIDADVGLTTDSAAASDTATASLIALTKRVAQNLTTLNTTPTVAGTNIIGRVGIDQTTPGTTNAVAANGIYSVTGNLSGLTAGAYGPAQLDPFGNIRSRLVVSNVTGGDGFSNTNLGWANNSSTNSASANMLVAYAPYRFNGTSWDRERKPASVSRNVSVSAGTSATLVKASAGDVTTITLYNASATVKFLKLYNASTAPTAGAGAPLFTLALPPTSQTNVTFPNGGLYFPTGIGYTLTGAAADTDTTALVAGDVVGLNIAFQ